MPENKVKTGTKPPSIKDVAREADVSIAAASYALNGREGVGRATRERILAVAKKLQYRPSKSAQTMRTGKTDTVGLVLPDLSNPFFPQFAKAVQQAASGEGLSVLLFDSDGDSQREFEGVNRLGKQGVDGIIWWPSHAGNCEKIADITVPAVLVDTKIDGFDMVTSDHWVGGKMLASLVNQSERTKVGLVRGPENFRSASLRRDGFVENLGPQAEVVWEEVNSFSPPLADNVLARLARSEAEVLVCPNDLIAIEAIRYLASLGLKVPDDIAVTGFGDIQFADIVSPPLTTISQPLSDLGREAFGLLNRRMENPEAKIDDVVLPVKLAVRRSFPGRVSGAQAA